MVNLSFALMGGFGLSVLGKTAERGSYWWNPGPRGDIAARRTHDAGDYSSGRGQRECCMRSGMMLEGSSEPSERPMWRTAIAQRQGMKLLDGGLDERQEAEGSDVNLFKSAGWMQRAGVRIYGVQRVVKCGTRAFYMCRRIGGRKIAWKCIVVRRSIKRHNWTVPT